MNLKVDYKQMGLRIGLRRRELGMKQTELAERASLSSNYISSVENGKSIPTIATLVKLCLVLDITPDYCLLGIMRSNDVPKNITDNLRLCSEDTMELISRILSDVLRYKVTRH
jgi:transcriptional regulator with XRE-family HTH domain